MNLGASIWVMEPIFTATNGAHREQIDAVDRRDPLDLLDDLRVLNHAGEQHLLVRLRHVLQQRRLAEIGGAAAGAMPRSPSGG